MSDRAARAVELSGLLDRLRSDQSGRGGLLAFTAAGGPFEMIDLTQTEIIAALGAILAYLRSGE